VPFGFWCFLKTQPLKGKLMKNYIQTGEKITIAAPYGVKSGGGALIGAMFGVAIADAANGSPVTIVREGVFSMKKLNAEAWTVGAQIYWDNTAKQCTKVVASNTLIGFAVEAAADPSATGVVVIGS
jgi:predicted RecA/RadA family phage recombinase